MPPVTALRRPYLTLALVGVLTTPSLALAQLAPPPVDGCRRLVDQLLDAELARYRPPPPPPAEPSWLDRLSRIGGADESEPSPLAEASFEKAKKAEEPRAPSAAASLSATDDARADPPRRSAARENKADKSSASGPRTYSRTNTQEAEVDEGDIIKTDGRTIYHVSCTRAGEQSGCRNELRIYSSWPARDAALLARYPISSRSGEAVVKQVYLHGSELVVLSSVREGRTSTPEYPSLDGQATRVLVLDVSTPRAPRVVREHLVEGTLVDSRMIGSRLYLASSSPAPRLPAALTQEVRQLIDMATQAGVQATTPEVARRLDPRWSHFVSTDPGLPHVRELGTSWNQAASQPAYGCADLSVATTLDGSRLLSLVQLDLRGGPVRGAGATGTGAQTVVYASEGAMYVADAVAPPAGRGWQTASLVRKFELGTGGQPRLAASGVVRGHALNQFALSEHAGHLRIATSDQWSGNSLYVMRATGDSLGVVGAVENLAVNERIYSVRMMGDRGYVVTFRRTDPLYTLDLSVPSQPRVVGELKVEGWSSYLHPLGNNHLLAVGQDADGAGRATGFHLQVFDVTDPRNPTRKFHHKLAAGSTSGAEGDHHAFMFEPETMTLSVPWKSDSYFGLIAFRVDPRQGFVDLGRVNHALMYKQYFQRQCAKASGPECRTSNYWYNFVSRAAIVVDRVVAIDDQLYSVSPAGMMVHRVGAEQLSLTTSVLVAAPAWRASSPGAVATGW